MGRDRGMNLERRGRRAEGGHGVAYLQVVVVVFGKDEVVEVEVFEEGVVVGVELVQSGTLDQVRLVHLEDVVVVHPEVIADATVERSLIKRLVEVGLLGAQLQLEREVGGATGGDGHGGRLERGLALHRRLRRRLALHRGLRHSGFVYLRTALNGDEAEGEDSRGPLRRGAGARAGGAGALSAPARLVNNGPHVHETDANTQTREGTVSAPFIYEALLFVFSAHFDSSARFEQPRSRSHLSRVVPPLSLSRPTPNSCCEIASDARAAPATVARDYF